MAKSRGSESPQMGSKYHNYPEKRLFHRRSCTDMLCLLVFVGCLAGWLYLGYFAISSTPPAAILAPTDSRSRRCGFDEEVKNKPYAFYFDLLKCVPPRANVLQCDTPRVCLSECPKENFYLQVFLNSANINVIRDKLICQDGFDKSRIYNKETAVQAIRDNNCAEWYLESKPIYRRCLYERLEMYQTDFVRIHFNESAGNETKLSESHIRSDVILSYVLQFISKEQTVFQLALIPFVRLLVLVGNRCLPKSLKSTPEEIVIAFETFGKKVESTIKGVTGKELFDVSKVLSDIDEFGHAVFKDLVKIWPWILVLVCGAAVISFAYIIIMRWLSGLMVWLSIFASVGLLLYSSYYTWNKFQELREDEALNRNLQVRQDYDIINLLWKKETWLGFFIISVSLLVVILITILFLRSRISLAIELIKEGSKAVTSSWSAVIFPVFPWTIQIAVVAYGVVIFAYLMNSGIPVRRVVGLDGSTGCRCSNDYKEGSFCTEEQFSQHCHFGNTNYTCIDAKCAYSESETEKQAIYLQFYNLLMFLWSLFFASGFGQMVLASTFATYYWTFNKNDLPVFMVAGGVWRVIRYHLGTVSFGSFLLALCNWLRALIEFFYNYLNKYDNAVVKFFKCCCSCFFWCLDKFLKFLNKNAYIMCAIHGKNFCSSARLAFNLLVRNILRVAILDRVTNFLFFLGKVMVTAALGILSFHVFSNPVPPIDDILKGDQYKVQYYFVPIGIVCVVTYFITSLFFGVYSMAVDTLFLCALEDLETNDGSAEKPYFMSKNLMKILKKKNEIKVK